MLPRKGTVRVTRPMDRVGAGGLGRRFVLVGRAQAMVDRLEGARRAYSAASNLAYAGGSLYPVGSPV